MGRSARSPSASARPRSATCSRRSACCNASRRTLAINVDGKLPSDVTAKDVILSIIGKIGVGGGTGHVIEYRGSAIRALSMEQRMTVCNMSIEAGARAGMIAPDDTTYQYMAGRPLAPQGAEWDAALANAGGSCRPTRVPDSIRRSASTPRSCAPMVTFGTNPGMVIPIDGAVPQRQRPGVSQGARVHADRGRQATAWACRSTWCSSARARTAA